MEIAVLGLGRMGRAVAARLLDGGHAIVVWNRTPGRTPSLVALGAREADDIGSAVARADLVLTSLATDDAVREVACGAGGVRPAIGDGTYVDVSTVSPALSAELDREFPRFAAMPILGSPQSVTDGKATYLLGGRSEVVAALEPVLPMLSESIRRYPSPPLASTAKLAVNSLLLDAVVALAEAFAVGRDGGLSDDELRQLFGDSPMVPPGLKNRFEGILTGHQTPWWSPALGAKDARLAVELVSGEGGLLPLTSIARDQYEKAAASAYGDGDIAAVANLYRRSTG